MPDVMSRSGDRILLRNGVFAVRAADRKVAFNGGQDCDPIFRIVAVSQPIPPDRVLYSCSLVRL
jgi:hypothetical protein